MIFDLLMKYEVPLVDGFLGDEGLVEEVKMHLYEDIYLTINYEASVIVYYLGG